MKLNYKIRVTAEATVLVVGAKSLIEARRLALDEVNNGKLLGDTAGFIGTGSEACLPIARVSSDFVSEETLQ